MQPKDYLAIASGLISVIAFFYIAWPQRRMYQIQATLQYFKDGDTLEAMADRAHLYGESTLDHSVARRVLSFFHRWGLAAKHGLLPLWVFDSITGQRVLELHRKLESSLADERKRSPDYAEGFLYLVNQIRQRHPEIEARLADKSM